MAADGSTIPIDGIPNLSYDQNTNRITSSNGSGQFQYDAAGNQIKALAEDGQTWLRYEYDYASRLSVVKRDSDGQALQAFQYSPTGGRLMNYDYLSNEFILYANSGGTTLAEYREFASAIPTWTKSFVYLGDGLLSTITSNGAGGETTEFNHPDRLGARVITNQATGGASEQTTLPFGTALNGESTITNNKNRFTTYDRSARTGLDYAVNRNYDSKQGRFTTVDPIGMSSISLAAPQTLNLYSYCGNDPINYTDPSGLFWGFFKSLFKWVMVAIAVVVAVLTIVAVPATIAGIFGAISAGANAASMVLNAAGFKKAGLILGLIAAATGFGSIIAGKIGPQHLLASEGKKRTFGFGVWFATLGGVGAINNSFSHNDKRKQNDEENLAIIAQTIGKVLERLKNNSKCSKTIMGGSSENPAYVLETVSKIPLSSTRKDVPVAVAPVGKGSKGFIGFYDGFFKKSVGSWTRETGMNSQRTREFVVLHELLHLSGSNHANVSDLDAYNSMILKDCFGVTAQR